jgi:hypothetical protein
MKITVKSIQCPHCGAQETHPTLKYECAGHTMSAVLIRGFKVLITPERGWESQCLVCSGYYDKNLNVTEENHNPEKGWFSESEMV